MIFATLDYSRKLNFNPELILKKSNKKFIKRWSKLEKLANKEKIDLKKLSLKKYNQMWENAKK